jgi:hypothetical protein
MALTDDLRRRILQANAIDPSRMSAFNDDDYNSLANRHGGYGAFGAPAQQPAQQSPAPQQTGGMPPPPPPPPQGFPQQQPATKTAGTTPPPLKETFGAQLTETGLPFAPQINFDDFQAAFNTTNPQFDLNRDGTVNFADFLQATQTNRFNNQAGVFPNPNAPVTQSGNNPSDDQIITGGPRFQPGMRAPGGIFQSSGNYNMPDGGASTAGMATNDLLSRLFGNQQGSFSNYLGDRFGDVGQGLNNLGFNQDALLGNQGVLGARQQDLLSNQGVLGSQIGGLDARLFGDNGLDARLFGNQGFGGIGGQVTNALNGANFGGRFTDLDTAIGGLGAGLGQTLTGLDEKLFGEQGFGGITQLGQDDIRRALFDDNRFGSQVQGALGLGNQTLSDRLGGLPQEFLQQLGLGDGQTVGDRFDTLGSGVSNIQDLLGSGAGSLQSRIGQDITGLGTNMGGRFDALSAGLFGEQNPESLLNRISGIGGQVGGLGTDIEGIRGLLNDPTFGLDRLRGDLSNIQTGVNDFGNVVGQQLGARFGEAGTPIDVGFGLQDIQDAVGSRQSIGDILASVMGDDKKIDISQAVEQPGIFSDLQTRLQGILQDDPFKATSELELADLGTQQERQKAQQMEELNRLGILRGGDTAGVLGDLSEGQNRERLQLQGNQEARRDRAVEQALGLGGLQSSFNLGEGGLGLEGQVQGGRQTLDRLLGLGDLGVREKEGATRNKQLEAELALQRERLGLEKSKRNDDLIGDILGGLKDFLPFFL